MRTLARRLLAASQSTSEPHVHEAVVVSEKLRVSLTRFAGTDGFASLLRRALVLASAELPSLRNVRIGADGRLEGLGAPDGEGGGGEAAVAITAQVLALLTTFVGTPLMLRLVRDAWPELSLDELLSTIEADS